MGPLFFKTEFYYIELNIIKSWSNVKNHSILEPEQPWELSSIYCSFFLSFLTEVQLIYNVVLVSGVQQSDSVIHTYVYFLINIYLFIFGCVVSSLLHTGSAQLRRAGATLRCGTRASHCGGFSCRGSRALGMRAQQLWLMGSRAQAQQLWHTDLVAPWHVGSSQTRDRTWVPCIGRRILNHCATGEVPYIYIFFRFFSPYRLLQNIEYSSLCYTYLLFFSIAFPRQY